MAEIPPDPRKHKRPAASNPVGKPEPKAKPDHVAASGKVIEDGDRRGSPPGVFGQPPHVPTDDTRATVKRMASFGNKHEEIALILGISEDTLTRHYAVELKTGGLELNNKIADKMATRALSDDHKGRAASRRILALSPRGMEGNLDP